MIFQVTASAKQSWNNASRVLWHLGARTTINGISENNMQENSRVGATFALPVNKHNSINSTSAPAYQPEPGGTSPPVGSPGNIAGAVDYDNARCF